MAFAEPVIIPCEECGGHRYNPTALSYCYKGKNIEDIMNLTIEEAYDFFDNSKIRNILQSMLDVGLEYLTLGQPTSTLSGGEVQRVKLASELHKRGQVFLLDEPSTGMHASDIEKLLVLLRKLVDEGNTVIMVEHRMELIAQADWIIDMGPEGGSGGGEILFTGTPEEILSCMNINGCLACEYCHTKAFRQAISSSIPGIISLCFMVPTAGHIPVWDEL